MKVKEIVVAEGLCEGQYRVDDRFWDDGTDPVEATGLS
jgi:hypothetical protein